MKYYSDVTKKIYDSAEACSEAEAKAIEAKKAADEAEAKRKAERKVRADAVDAAYKAAVEANKNYRALLKDFVKDYGSYHVSYNGDGVDDIFEAFFNSFI